MAPYSVDNDFFAAQGVQGRELRHQMIGSLDLDPRLPTICFAGKLQPYKRPLDVVEAIRQMSSRANLLIIGEGPLGHEVRRAAANLPTVRVLGFVNQSTIGHWYGACDVLVLPSDSEPWGLVVNEAMAAGAIPVVSSEVGCGPDLVRPGGGIVFPVGDATALAASLDRLFADPRTLVSARKLNQRIIQDYSITDTARGYERGAALAIGVQGLR
jgi:glycosyltransferase involved in cell wall biosynthesis